MGICVAGILANNNGIQWDTTNNYSGVILEWNARMGASKWDLSSQNWRCNRRNGCHPKFAASSMG